MRSKLYLLIILLLLFVYYRGIQAVAEEKNLECEYHVVYALCKQKGKATELPSIWEVLRAGMKF